MAANFWSSSHYKLLLDPEEVDFVHQLDRDRGITLEDFKLIKMHMANYIAKLAQIVKVRQRVVATAITYMRRVYVRKAVTEYDPRIIAPSCLYLASKAEESTVQAKLLVFYIKKNCTEFILTTKYGDLLMFCLPFRYAGSYSGTIVSFADPDEKYRLEIKDILEMEMKILEALNFYLVVFHPYRSLSELLQDAGMNDATQLTWGLVNDTYKMDLILKYPPHLIALACVYIASVLTNKENAAWFEELRVDMNAVKNIAMEILDFYDNHKTNTEERVGAAMMKLNR